MPNCFVPRRGRGRGRDGVSGPPRIAVRASYALCAPAPLIESESFETYTRIECRLPPRQWAGERVAMTLEAGYGAVCRCRFRSAFRCASPAKIGPKHWSDRTSCGTIKAELIWHGTRQTARQTDAAIALFINGHGDPRCLHSGPLERLRGRFAVRPDPHPDCGLKGGMQNEVCLGGAPKLFRRSGSN